MTDENEDILSSDENNLISIRRKKLSEIRTKRQAFPNDFKKSVSSSWVVSELMNPRNLTLKRFLTRSLWRVALLECEGLLLSF